MTFENGYQETPRSDHQMQRQNQQQQQQQQQLLQQVLPSLLCRFVWWHIIHMCACRHAKTRVPAYFLFSSLFHQFVPKTPGIYLRGFARKVKCVHASMREFSHRMSICTLLQHTATHCNTLQHTATHCNTLQHTETHCNTLQHTATHVNKYQ